MQNEKTKYVKDPEKLISINNSINVRDTIYRRFFSDTDFEKTFIDDLTKADIEEFCFTLLREKNIKKKAFMDMRNILSSVFRLHHNCTEIRLRARQGTIIRV